MITLQQGTIYLGTAAPASGGGGSATATSVENKNTAVGATNPLNFWEGTSAEYESGGGSQTWYNWQSGGGLSFNSSTLPETPSSGAFAFGNNKFIFARYFYRNQNKLYISNDNGITWNTLNFDISSQYNSSLNVGGIAYGNNTWVATTFNAKYGLYSEDDGQSWTLVNLPGQGNQWYGTSFGNNIFIALSEMTGETIYSTNNGKTWNLGGNLPGSTQNWSLACFCNDRFVAVAKNTNKGAYTTDCLTWTAITLPISANYTSIAYGNGKLVLGVYADTDNVYYTEDFGQTWNVTTIPFIPYSISFGNDKFLFVNELNACYTTDLINFTNITLPTKAYWSCYGNNTFVYANLWDSNTGYSTGGQSSEVFTTDSAPTTSSQVYSAPNTISTLTITSVGTGTITLSDTNTYNYNSSGNQTTTQSVGEAHPDWICLIEGVGIKKGSTTIASIAPTVDQTYSASSTNAQSGVAVASGIADTLGTINTQLESIIAQGD